MNVCENSNGPVSMTCTLGSDKTGVKQKHLLDFPITCVIYLPKCHGAKFLLPQVLCMQSFPYENHCKCYKKLALISQPVLFTLTYFFVIHKLSSSAAKSKVVAIIVFFQQISHSPFNYIYFTRLF